MPLTFLSEDITRVAADAIVNAANTQLRAGGGVCGAIFRAAGHEKLQAACNRIGGCQTGQAVITAGFALPAKYVIHTVGPQYHPGAEGQATLLRECYENSLALARRYGLRSIAFPLISTGKYGYPKWEALDIAIYTIVYHLEYSGDDLDVSLCLLDPELLSAAESIKNHTRGKIGETKGLTFKSYRVKFYPEDEEKMKHMNTKERLEYKIMLKTQGRYSILDFPDVAEM